MKKIAIALSNALAALLLSGPASAAPAYVYDGGLGTWSDVNKTNVFGNPDSLLCWAASASNLLSWTGWRGWDNATSSYISTAGDIYARFDAGWTNRTGAPTYAYEWWMTNRVASILPGGIAFDSPGLNFYPGVHVQDGHALSVTAFVPEINHAQDRDAIIGYVTADRGIAITIEVPLAAGVGTYNHSLTVWGIDDVTNDIYVTDSDDGGVPQLTTYRIFQAADTYWYIDNYTNLYTAAQDAKILEVFRLNRNDAAIEPRRDGAAPEPGTMILIGIGLIGLAGLRARKKA